MPWMSRVAKWRGPCESKGRDILTHRLRPVVSHGLELAHDLQFSRQKQPNRLSRLQRTPNWVRTSCCAPSLEISLAELRKRELFAQSQTPITFGPSHPQEQLQACQPNEVLAGSAQACPMQRDMIPLGAGHDVQPRLAGTQGVRKTNRGHDSGSLRSDRASSSGSPPAKPQDAFG